MPGDLAGFGPDGEHRGAIEIVTLADLSIPRTAVARAPIHQVKVWIVGARQPRRAAAMLPGVARPGIAAWLPRSRNGVAAPELGAGVWIPPVNEAPDAVLGPGDTRDHHVMCHKRCDGKRVSGLEVNGLRTPQFLAGFHVEGYDIGVQGGAIQLAFVE